MGSTGLPESAYRFHALLSVDQAWNANFNPSMYGICVPCHEANNLGRGSRTDIFALHPKTPHAPTAQIRGRGHRLPPLPWLCTPLVEHLLSLGCRHLKHRRQRGGRESGGGGVQGCQAPVFLRR